MGDEPDMIRLWREGLIYEDSGDLSNAIEKYKEALDVAPPNGYGTSLIWMSSASAFQKADMYDIAVTCYKGAIEADDTNDDAYIPLIKLLTNMGQYGEAVNYIDKYLIHYPEDDFAWSHKAVLLDILKRPMESKRCLEKAEELNPENPQVLAMKYGV